MSDFSKIALSGLKASSAKLSVTAQNLSNADTVGYKQQDIQFSALFASGGSKGANGIGVKTADVSTDFSDGGMSSTGNELHHAISGNGFFVVKTEDGGEMLSRTGLFEFNVNGQLVDQSGNLVQGYQAGAEQGVVSDIVLDKSPLTPIPSTSGSINLNLGTDEDGTAAMTSSQSIVDSLGTEHTLQVKFTNKVMDPVTGEATWDVAATVNGDPVTLTGTSITFDASGNIIGDNGALSNGTELAIDLTGLTPAVQGVGNITMEMGNTTGYAGETTIREQSIDGNSVAEFSSYQIEQDGKILAYYSDGRSSLIGQLGLASVSNVAGLSIESEGYYKSTTDSGNKIYGVSGGSGLGSVTSGALEGSNVDTSDQLVKLIEGQRSFQSCSKIITASKETTQALMQAI